MEVQLYTGSTLLGTVNATVIDESMGVVGGILRPTINYFAHFQSFFQTHTLLPDWGEIVRLELSAFTRAIGDLNCAGGINITDVKNFDEISVEFCGVNRLVMDEFGRY